MEDKNRREKITISVPAWLVEIIRSKVKEAGITVSDYVKELVLKDLFEKL